jgi:uncharacterized protein YeaO (DUF488 family)
MTGHQLWVKRVYDSPTSADGTRVLVDRVSPRGVTKARAGVDLWLREVEPSVGLRTWFGHDRARWQEFKARYRDELQSKPREVARIRDLMSAGTVTLLFAAHDLERNNAVALAEYLRHVT